MKLISWNVNGLRAVMGKNFMELFETIYGEMSDTVALIGGSVPATAMSRLFQHALILVIKIVLPIFLVGFIVAFISDIQAQIGKKKFEFECKFKIYSIRL